VAALRRALGATLKLVLRVPFAHAEHGQSEFARGTHAQLVRPTVFRYAVTPARVKQIRVLGVETCLRLACAVFVVVLIVIFVEAPRLSTKMTIMIAESAD